MADQKKRRGSRPLLLILVIAMLGIAQLAGGVQLVALGGSLYYLVAGIVFVIVALLAWRCSGAAAWLYAAYTAATILWALAEVGFHFWPLLPRVFGPAVVGLWFAVPRVRRQLGHAKAAALAGPALFIVQLCILAGAYAAHDFEPASVSPQTLAQTTGGTEITSYAGDASGNHFAPPTQITRENVGKLKLAWTYRTGDLPIPGDSTDKGSTFEASPLKIDDALYLCTGHNIVIAVDADTGRELWRFDPKFNRHGLVTSTCRGVSYHAGPPSGPCPRRLIVNTLDSQLIALDLRTGKPCPDFGSKGVVDLTVGITPVIRGYYSHTSPPVVAGNALVVGSWIFDNQSTDEPSGAVRAYHATTGALLWAWDGLHPEPATLKPGESYPRNSPNAWGVFTADSELGLVYVPTGNTPPDFFAGARNPEQNRYSSAVVALDGATGALRWSFQTVHRDVWDYDIGSQPVLADFAGRPALLMPTKRGEVFVLDRRTGRPMTHVVERPVPQGGVPGERLSPTQPFQTDFPSFVAPPLSEASMWGATPIDQMVCRIRFRQSRYEGPFTPPSTAGTLVYPPSSGTISWGGVSVDPQRNIMVVNTNALITFSRLVPRVIADKLGVVPYDTSKPGDPAPAASSIAMFAQHGTPYAVELLPFFSPLRIPCSQPPWGELVAVDLNNGKLLWKRPLGTTRDNAPLGMALPIGVFSQGGSVVTGSGLVFIGATLDNYLRAFDIRNGEELWKGRLPAGGQATPISYTSYRTGKQYVVIAAGGHSLLETKRGDYLVAYSLER